MTIINLPAQWAFFFHGRWGGSFAIGAIAERKLSET